MRYFIWSAYHLYHLFLILVYYTWMLIALVTSLVAKLMSWLFDLTKFVTGKFERKLVQQYDVYWTS